MIYASARFANAERTAVLGTDVNGNTETVPHDYTLFRQPDDGPIGFVNNGGVIAPYVEPPASAAPVQPHLYAAVAICIAASAISVIEQAAQLSSATYEDGWVMIGFSEPQDTSDYLIFAQTDLPVKIEQFKSDGYFELVFSDPSTGVPVEPGRIDIQILKVR